MRSIKVNSKAFDSLVTRGGLGKIRLEKKVSGILQKVRTEGDKAILSYTKKFDKVDLKKKDLRVTEAEISGAYQDIKPGMINTLKEIIRNVNKFYSPGKI